LGGYIIKEYMKLFYLNLGQSDGIFPFRNIILAGQSNAVGRVYEDTLKPSDIPLNGEIPNAQYWNLSNFVDYGLEMNAFDDHLGDWGVEYRLAKYVTDIGEDFKLLKYAQGGSTVVTGDWNADTGSLTANMIIEANQANITWDAIVWIQGENDADSEFEAINYEVELTKLINKFRTDINNASNIPFIIIRLFDFNYPTLHWIDEIQQAQDNISNNMSNIHLVTPPANIDIKTDNIHYSAAGLDTLAKEILKIRI